MRVSFSLNRNVFAVWLGTFYFFTSVLANDIDITRASLVFSTHANSSIEALVSHIIEKELQVRSNISWTVSDRWQSDIPINIAFISKEAETLNGVALPWIFTERVQSLAAEGYGIFQQPKSTSHTIWLVYTNNRSVVFALGALLRAAHITSQRITIDAGFEIVTAPDYPIRGHQLGYRNTANSYDAWSVTQYEDYIRELALFGTNAIENIPFGHKNDSPHMKISRAEMNTHISNICARYDLDYWVWTPATFDLKDSALRSEALKEHESFYQKCPRLNEVFFPGGDPGHNHPREVLPFLRELAQRLKKYHPGAGIWISLQGFNEEQVDFFYEKIKHHKPTWLLGVVSGPSSPAISETRFRLPDQYLHRHYPDITHNVRCDYPVEQWDQAFALTLGREAINPQPYYYARIHERYAPFTDGFVSYSDGVHDDVNKFIWSQRGWDSHRDVGKIITEYCRYFFGTEVADQAANGIFALERNWVGPLAENGGVEMTLAFWQQLELAHPDLQLNWRWQLLLMRAYYDAYTRRRLIYEQNLERQANKILLHAGDFGSSRAMDSALLHVQKCESHPIAQDLRQKIHEYGAALYESIGLQTDYEQHQASGAERGCILTFADHPLNNRWWLEDQFKTIDSLATERDKLDRLHVLATWEEPGSGSYYDNISNIAQSPHVQTRVDDATDFAWWNNGKSRARLSSQTFQHAPILAYEDLDPNGRYLVRIGGYGDALLRADGRRLEPVLYDKGLEEFKEFIIPRHLVGDGKLRITFDRPEESHLNWRHRSRVSDVWLLKQ